jgi:hypothetical protein
MLSFLTEKMAHTLSKIGYLEPPFIHMKCKFDYILNLQIILFWTYNIDKSSFEHHIYDINP